MRYLLLGWVLITTSVWADVEPFDCSKSPGRDLCLKIRRVESYIASCDGDSCYSLWRSYLTAMDSLSNFYVDHFLPKDTFSLDIGELAYSLARNICTFEKTGDIQWLSRLALAENRLLPQLKEIQQIAKMPVIETCTISVGDSQ
ncbi:MAG: hypothetical protein ACKOA8_20710 [Deltaproteobacteria bacterium]